LANYIVSQDVDGKEYIDFIVMLSAVNTGRCNPKILAAVTEQMNKSKCFPTSPYLFRYQMVI
jgi:4-aminobutyrate aminotransferase-like enzyme